MGACNVEAKIQWVKKPSDAKFKNVKFYRPNQVEKKEKDDLIPLNWRDYSWEYPGWNDSMIRGEKTMKIVDMDNEEQRPELQNLKFEKLRKRAGLTQ